MGTIAENIEEIQREKAQAAERCGRNPEDILLIAVTKTGVQRRSMKQSEPESPISERTGYRRLWTNMIKFFR